MQMNPFRVERRTTVAPLRVEAQGFETFNVMVLPEKDETIQVSLMVKQKASRKEKPRSSRDDKRAVRDRALEAAARLGGSVGGGDSLLKAEQQLVYTRNKRYLKRCYDQALERGDAPRDKVLSINMKLLVHSGGKVSDVSLSGPGTTIPSLNDCLKRQAMGWTFPKGEYESPVEFSFAFTTKE